MDTIDTGLRELFQEYEELPLSVDTVVSNDNLLMEILLRLPVVSLVLFKSVSKRWLSLIKDDAFIKRRGRMPNTDPPSALLIQCDSETNVCTFGSVSFDVRIPSQAENIFITVPGRRRRTSILDSCNGLFLCSVKPGNRICVYNPTLKLFKMLPAPLDCKVRRHRLSFMDFDPTKSPHYKVMHATAPSLDGGFHIQTYSSETGIWSIVCSCSDPFRYLENGTYLNDTIHWLSKDSDSFLHYKLDLVNRRNTVRTKIKLPVDSSCMVCKSRGCLLLIGMDTNRSHQLSVYEMRNGHSEWSMKYSIKHTRFAPIDIRCIALGEREEDSFMVLGGFRSCFYLYNFMLNTFRELPDLQSMSPEKIYDLESFLICNPDYAFTIY